MNKFPTITLLIDGTQVGDCKSMKAALNRYYQTKCASIIVFSEMNIVPPVENFICVTPDDFNFWGGLKKEKSTLIDSMASDMFINCVRTQPKGIETDYIAAFCKSNFKVTLRERLFSKLYELSIDTKRDQDIVSQLDVLAKYLKVLNGNEK